MTVRLRVGEPLAATLAERFAASPVRQWLRVDAISPPGPVLSAAEGDWIPTFDGVVPLAGRAVRLRSSTRSDGYRVDAEGLASFAVLPGGGEIRQLGRSAAPPAVLEELALGPPLVLALALRRCWCLHASGIRFAGRDGRVGAALFVGASGLGKSTLAAAFGTARIADDVVPVTAGPGGALVLPRFPQLKLRPEDQPDALPESLPLAAAYLLAYPSAAPRLEIRRMTPSEAALQLVRETVASRLMSSRDLRRNVEDAGRIAAEVPVATLAFERIRERLPEVAEALRDDLRAA